MIINWFQFPLLSYYFITLIFLINKGFFVRKEEFFISLIIPRQPLINDELRTKRCKKSQGCDNFQKYSSVSSVFFYYRGAYLWVSGTLYESRPNIWKHRARLYSIIHIEEPNRTPGLRVDSDPINSSKIRITNQACKYC